MPSKQICAWRKINARRGKKNAAKKKCAPDSDIWRRTQKGNSPRTVTHDAQPGNRARTPAEKLRTEGDFHAQQHSRGGGGAGACALGAVVHNFGVAVGRWSLIGVRAAGVCLFI